MKYRNVALRKPLAQMGFTNLVGRVSRTSNTYAVASWSIDHCPQHAAPRLGRGSIKFSSTILRIVARPAAPTKTRSRALGKRQPARTTEGRGGERAGEGQPKGPT